MAETGTSGENPAWENARKALEAVSPSKAKKDTNENVAAESNSKSGQEQQQNGNTGPAPAAQRDMSGQDMYYQQLNNYQKAHGVPRNPSA